MTQTRIDWKLVLLSLLAILLLSHAVTAGFPEDWAYRKQFTLNNSGNALTDYQVRFTVYRSTGTDSGTTVYVGTKCQEDYDDIRFTDTSGTVLSYWIESSDSSSATIPLQDTSVGYLFIFLAVFALIVTIMAVIEVVREFTSGEGYEID